MQILLKFEKKIYILLIIISILTNIWLTFNNVSVQNNLKYSSLLDPTFIGIDKVNHPESSGLNEVFNVHYFQNHTLLIDFSLAFIKHSGTTTAFFLLLTLKLILLTLFVKLFQLEVSNKRNIYIAFLLLISSSSFTTALTNYFLDIISLIFYILILIKKVKYYKIQTGESPLPTFSILTTKYKPEVSKPNNSLLHLNKDIVAGVLSGILCTIFIYLNPIHLVLLPVFLFSGNKFVKNYTLSYLVTIGLLFTILLFAFNYNLLATMSVVLETNQFGLIPLRLLKHYLGLFIFLTLFYYLIFSKKWKSGVVGIIQYKLFYVLLLFILLPFLSNYFLSLYLMTLLLIYVLPFISNVLAFYQNSDTENRIAVLNFFIAYVFINLYLTFSLI